MAKLKLPERTVRSQRTAPNNPQLSSQNFAFELWTQIPNDLKRMVKKVGIKMHSLIPSINLLFLRERLIKTHHAHEIQKSSYH